jgi:hypothetical protein
MLVGVPSVEELAQALLSRGDDPLVVLVSGLRQLDRPAVVSVDERAARVVPEPRRSALGRREAARRARPSSMAHARPGGPAARARVGRDRDRPAPRAARTAASVPRAEPIRKMTIAVCSTSLRPYWSPSFPYTGPATVEESRYAVTTQERSEAPPRSPSIVGNAVETIVWSSEAAAGPAGARRR